MVNNQIIDKLNLSNSTHVFVPYLSVYNRKYTNEANLEKLKEFFRKKHSKKCSFLVKSLIVYQQKSDKDVFKPFMEIPLKE